MWGERPTRTSQQQCALLSTICTQCCGLGSFKGCAWQIREKNKLSFKYVNHYKLTFIVKTIITTYSAIGCRTQCSKIANFKFEVL